MKRWMRTVPALVLVGLVSLILACGSDSDSTPVPQATASSQIAATLGSVTATAGTGGVFRRLWNEPPTLDPHQVGDVDSAGVIVEIFSGLVTLSTDLQVEPDLAERWEVSDDGLVYTFFSRSNAKFNDGKPVTAEDVR